MHVGVGSSGAVVSCLGGDGGCTPPQLIGKSRSSKYVNVWMLSGKINIPILDNFNFNNIVRKPIEGGRFSTKTFLDKSSSFKCVNDSMLFGMVDIFVPDKSNFYNDLRAAIEHGRLNM